MEDFDAVERRIEGLHSRRHRSSNIRTLNTYTQIGFFGSVIAGSSQGGALGLQPFSSSESRHRSGSANELWLAPPMRSVATSHSRGCSSHIFFASVHRKEVSLSGSEGSSTFPWALTSCSRMAKLRDFTISMICSVLKLLKYIFAPRNMG